MNGERMVRVPLDDLCVIADAMGAMKHDLDNGKRKHLEMEIARIHAVVEVWAHDENGLGGADCHDDHRCRSCRDFPVLSGLMAAGRQPDVPIVPMPSEPAAPGGVEHAEPSDAQISPAHATTMLEVVGKRQYIHEDAVFILESLSDSVVRVTHREQSGYFGFSRNRDPSNPYTTASSGYGVSDRGIDGMAGIFTYSSPDAALKALCDSMLRDQRREDARRTNPEQR